MVSWICLPEPIPVKAKKEGKPRYIINKGDLYGKVVRVEFISFLRPEQKFSGLQELTAQISRDLRQTLILLGEEAEGALLPGSGSVAD